MEAARAAGADAVAITSGDDDPATAERFAAAVRRGDLAAWPYDAAHAGRAADPRAFYAGVRSVVTLAVRYANAGEETPPRGARPSPRGRVARYARGDDYHRRVGAIATATAAAIDALARAPVTRVLCDTVPLAERAFAARAGLGWIGKHTNLIVPGAGSYVFLAEVLTTLDLGADPPRRTSCGSCVRCVRACPTGALRGDHTIDASRCISDLTQRTDAIPRELRPLVGTWLWGCDLCQEVCPPTRRAPRVTDLPPDADDGDLDALALLELRSGAFKRRFRATAMGWRGAAILRRNAALVLGNALDRAAVPALARALGEDPHPLVRGQAAWSLGRIDGPAARAALSARESVEPDVSVRAEIAHALAGTGARRETAASRRT